MHKVRQFILSFLAPKVCQLNDVVLTRNGKAYWVQPGRLVEMRVVRWPRIEEAKSEQ